MRTACGDCPVAEKLSYRTKGYRVIASGRIVVITGAGGGIGSALVKRFIANEDIVVAADLSGSALDRLAEEVGPDPRLVRVQGDLTDEAACRALAAAADQAGGRVDVLVNCSGYFPAAPFETIGAALWREIIEINLTSPFLVTQAILPLMKRTGAGRIINYGSGSFFKGPPNQAHYISAKAGLIGLSRCLATELGDCGITVNIITPGLTSTDAVRRELPADFIAGQMMTRAIKREQTPEDLVGATFFLASPDADFITGQIVNVDGGAIRH
jgi:3-oxoacyl-[acyl-carrier protein] reductase